MLFLATFFIQYILNYNWSLYQMWVARSQDRPFFLIRLSSWDIWRGILLVSIEELRMPQWIIDGNWIEFSHFNPINNIFVFSSFFKTNRTREENTISAITLNIVNLKNNYYVFLIREYYKKDNMMCFHCLNWRLCRTLTYIDLYRTEEIALIFVITWVSRLKLVFICCLIWASMRWSTCHIKLPKDCLFKN